MASPVILAVAFGAVGIALMIAELGLPTHGIVGILGVVSILCGVGACFWINAWLGLAVLLTLAALTPVVWAAVVNLWPKTPTGRRLVLSAVTGQTSRKTVTIGQTGVACSEMRPWGECEFGGVRVEASSEYGIIKAGVKVRVVALNDGRAIVRAI